MLEGENTVKKIEYKELCILEGLVAQFEIW